MTITGTHLRQIRRERTIGVTDKQRDCHGATSAKDMSNARRAFNASGVGSLKSP
jgi:hypothetical protein